MDNIILTAKNDKRVAFYDAATHQQFASLDMPASRGRSNCLSAKGANMRLGENAKSRIFLASLMVLFFASGCASFPGGELPTYTRDQLWVPEKKVSASYDVKAFSLGKENARFASKLETDLQRVLLEGPLFSELKSVPSQSDFHLSFVLRNEGEPPLPVAFLNGFISGFTFTIIPAYARDILILEVSVTGGNRQPKTYTYKDHIDFWLQLFLVFLAPTHWPPDVRSKVVDNMIMNFARDFGNDLRSGAHK